MKKQLFLVFLIICNQAYTQTDFTFCNGSVSVTIFGGGHAEMIRYNPSGSIVKKVSGEFNLYGVGSPTELLKISFNGTEYSYDLIRNGAGTPSVIIDATGRRYTLCKESTNEKSRINSAYENSFGFNSRSSKNNINDTVIIGNLVIMKNDVNYGTSNWYDANDACKRLGPGWRLPDQNELNSIYNNKNDKIKFSDNYYWSSTEVKIKETFFYGDVYSNGAYALDFIHQNWGPQKFVIGENTSSPIENKYYSKAVRELNNIEKKLISDALEERLSNDPKNTGQKVFKVTTTKEIDSLEVMTIDLGVMNFNKATFACTKIGDGWHLPNIDELETLYKNKDIISGFSNNKYLTSDIDGFGEVSYVDFNNGVIEKISSNDKLNIRLVRTKLK